MFKQKEYLIIIAVIGLIIFSHLLQRAKVNTRVEAVNQMTWMDSYDTPVPEGYTATECLEDPGPCLDATR